LFSALKGWLLGVLALLVAAACLTIAIADQHPSARATSSGQSTSRPNIVLIVTDDMRADELSYLPHIRRLLMAQGVTYTNAISPHPLCCPARASLATGQYAQNNGVQHNEGPWGGYPALRQPRNTIAAWLHDAGYHTGFHGKYLNLYQRAGRRPPGWDVWQPQLNALYAYGQEPTRYAGGIQFRHTYITRQIQQLTERSIRAAVRSDEPFFEWINHVAPHPAKIAGHPRQKNPVYEQRYAGAYARVVPPVIREGAFRGSASNRQFLIADEQARLRSLRSVDDAVARTVRQLRQAGELLQTYFVLTSDNGYQLGEHGILGKNRLYEGSLRVPFVVRGPGIEPGTRDDTPVSLVDLVPTFLDWAGARPGRTLDGLSLDTITSGSPVRDTMLIQTGDQRRDASPGWWWRGVRTSDYVYATPVGRPRNGFLYDLDADPDEHENLIRRPGYGAIRSELARRTRILSDCSGQAACNQVFGPLPPVR
jgi:arylsulfatase A-like enzyme